MPLLVMLHNQCGQLAEYPLNFLDIKMCGAYFILSYSPLLVCVAGIALGVSDAKWHQPILGQKVLVLRMCFRSSPVKREFWFLVFQLLGALMIMLIIVLCDLASLQLFGGIQRYLEQFPDGGYFKGKNFVFDHRYEFPTPLVAPN